MKTTEKKVQMISKPETTEQKKYQMTSFDMDKVEELETAIAPGGFGFGCGCKGIFGAFCG